MTNYTLSPVWGAGAQLLTNNATPLSGGKIYVYEAGTTTPAVTYTDPFGVVPNTNPIVANAAGRLASEIWFPVGASFKFVLKDATDVLIATYDNIPSVPQPPFSNEATGISYSTPYLVSASAFTAGVTYTIAFVGSTDFTLIGATSNTVGVTFTASGPGTGTGTAYYTRTIQSKLQDTVSVKDFRAVGDGVTDDTAAIQAALSSVAVTGGILLFPPGTYKITSGLTQTVGDGVNIAISGYGAKIDATALTGTSTNALQIKGSRVATTSLSANILKNADTFTVASAASISAGRVLLISSTDLWNPTRPYYYKGEMVLVERVSGTTITNSNFMYDSYLTGSTTVHILNMPYVTVEGLEIIANADITGLSLDYVRNPTIRNCTVHGARYAAINAGYILGGLIDGNYVYDAWNGLVTGTSYGVAVGTGQGCKVSHNTIYNTRHAVTCGGFEPNRETIVANNTCHNSTLEDLTGAIDLHGNSELCSVVGNIATNINCSGINILMSDNQLNSAETNVPAISIFQEISSSFYTVQNNRIVASGATAYGVWLCPNEPNLTVDVLTITGNTATSALSCIRLQPRSVAATGCSVTSCFISGNVLQTTGSDSSFTLTDASGTTYAVVDLFSSNNIYQSNYTSFFTNSTVTLIKSVGDVFKSNRASSYLATFGGVDVHLTAPVFRGNIGGAGACRSVYYTNTGRIDVLNPTYKDVNERAEIASATTYAESGWHGGAPSVLNTAGAKLINFYGSLGRAITYGAAAPTTNTWAIGDRVYNLTPAGGQPKSWVCTVAGTPGTWVSEGNL